MGRGGLHILLRIGCALDFALRRGGLDWRGIEGQPEVLYRRSGGDDERGEERAGIGSRAGTFRYAGRIEFLDDGAQRRVQQGLLQGGCGFDDDPAMTGIPVARAGIG